MASAEIQFAPELQTQIPLFTGVGASMEFDQQFVFGGAIGLAPSPFISLVGEAAAQAGENSSYKTLIEDAFTNNWAFRVYGEAGFTKSPQRWFVGAAFSYIETSGTSDIDSVLSAATGKNYTTLLTLLRANGKSTNMSLSGFVMILDISIGRYIPIHENFYLKASAGVAKVVNAESELSTELTNFDNSNPGRQLLTESEGEIEDIVINYGWSPTLGVSLHYSF